MPALRLVIGNKNYSTWSLRPWLLLTAMDLEFEEQPASLRAEGLSERLGAFSPTARVPVLLDGDTAIWDSLAICEHVSERYLDGRGWPSDPDARSYARCLAAEMHSGFGSLRNEMPMNIRAKRRVEASPGCLADIARMDAIFGAARTAYAASGDFLAGPFSIADCMFAPVVMRFVTYGVALSPEAQAYADRLRAHPALQKWIQDALLETEVVEEDEAGEDVT